MRPEDLARCLEEAFGGLEPPALGALPASDTYMDQSFVDAIQDKRWQDLRPMPRYVGDASEIVLLSANAYQYYLPAYLYAFMDEEGDQFYLNGVLDSLWHEAFTSICLVLEPSGTIAWPC